MTSAQLEGKALRCKRVKPSDLVEGMLIAEAIKTQKGALIVPADTLITNRQIQMLVENDVRETFVVKDSWDEFHPKHQPVAQETNDQKTAKHARDSHANKKGSVVIVDDDHSLREILQRMLSKAGFEVLDVCWDGNDVVKQMDYLEPDIITLDISMPKLDGVAALKHILKKRPKQKVVMISGMNDGEKIKECIRAGAKWYLLKPFDTERVIDTLNSVLNSH